MNANLVSEDSLPQFVNRLNTTCRWCEGKAAVLELRTTELDPQLSEFPTYEEICTALDGLDERRRLLTGDTPVGPTLHRYHGRLLCCDINLSFVSGESESVSDGYFDIADRPPWDTWIWCYRTPNEFHPDEYVETLVSWTVGRLVAAVERGIKFNPYDCLYWAPEQLIKQIADYGVTFAA